MRLFFSKLEDQLLADPGVVVRTSRVNAKFSTVFTQLELFPVDSCLSGPKQAEEGLSEGPKTLAEARLAAWTRA